MNCHDCRDVILDVVRGVAEGAAERQARCHMESCAACTAYLQQQRWLTAGLRALVATCAREEPTAGIEQRFLAAVENASAPAGSNDAAVLRAPAQRVARQAARHRWFAAAASVALVASLVTWWQASRPIPQPGGTVRVEQTQPGPAPAGQRIAGHEGHSATAVEARATSPGTTTVAASGAGHRGRPKSPRVVQAVGDFVPLPAAATLPPFEHGEIVRVRIRLASLANLGFTVQPDAADPTPIDADLLVAQDGQPRAIRLVTNESQASSRSMR